MEQITRIATFIFESFLHIWPYLLITVPLAVLVRLTNASKVINKALSRNPLVSILFATILGALSPFCSCGVIPVIASLLLGGVPLGPVMSFWIASPSMDPEIFFLSTAAIGWKLSVWRLVATFVISLLSGYITHMAVKNGFIGKDVLRTNKVSPVKNLWDFLWNRVIKVNIRYVARILVPDSRSVQISGIPSEPGDSSYSIQCCVGTDCSENSHSLSCSNEIESCNSGCGEDSESESFIIRLLSEVWRASALVIKFMAIAFFINALIAFYVPEDFIANLLGGRGGFSVIISSLVGIPVYTSNITALPLISGLLSLGMNQGAALAFLIAGPTTTLPAMMAVWGITKRKVFILYVTFSLVGAILFGFLYLLVN